MRHLDALANSTGHLTTSWKKRNVTLVLGNDREIGRAERSQERRVGLTPEQVRHLIAFLRDLELLPAVLVVENAGSRAGYADADYVHAGAEVVTVEELRWHDGPPDVVHALKEPSSYEATIPGPFCRIGALHAGGFHEDSGFALLAAGAKAAILDGSNIGCGATGRIPIRGRMSVFAGEIAADWVVEHLERRQRRGRVVVVGAGYAGRACARRLLGSDRVGEVVLLDRKDPARLAPIRAEFEGEGRVRVAGAEGMDDRDLIVALRGAEGAVFAVAVPGGRAPKVVTLDGLRGHLSPDGIAVDVSIDERGAIADPGIQPDWPASRIIEFLEQGLSPIRYRAASNMPRACPHEASEAHGEVVLPYVATLLLLSALENGPPGVIRRLRALPVRRDNPDPLAVPAGEAFEAFIQDLRNGLACYPHEGAFVLTDTIPQRDRELIERFLTARGVQVVLPEDASSKPAP